MGLQHTWGRDAHERGRPHLKLENLRRIDQDSNPRPIRFGSSTDPQICINRFTHIEKKVSQILTITLVRISKRLKKENHEIKIPEDRKLKKKQAKFHEQMKPEF